MGLARCRWAAALSPLLGAGWQHAKDGLVPCGPETEEEVVVRCSHAGLSYTGCRGHTVEMHSNSRGADSLPHRGMP
eukprot:scaffold157055_cov15-Tisochrysis_lutea.AAC.1